jgi:hypothetical protein
MDNYPRILAFLNDCIAKLRQHAQFFRAAEVNGLMGAHLFSSGLPIIQRLRTKMRDTEKRRDANDLEMCNL